MPYEIIITKEFDGVKPKNFLKKTLDIPFFKVIDFIRDKRITLNGKKIKKDDVLRTGAVIKVWKDDIKLREVKKEFREMKDLNIPIVFESDDFMVLNKPSGVIVQGAQDNSTSLSLHLAWYKNQINDKSDFEYFHVHRLDKETSGALVVAKNGQTLRELNRVFRDRGVAKKYICLCSGEFEEKRGKVEVFLERTPQEVREKVKVVKKKTLKAKRSLSFYKVIKEFEYKDEVFSLVEVEIKTGVTHQIRVHMKHLGHPIVGDKMYGNSAINRKFEGKLDRQFLHASFI